MSLDLRRLAATANLAPSVHNTQPTRWSLGDDGALWLSADLGRQLAIGDPEGRDLRLSLGTALEGTILALGQQGLSVRSIDHIDEHPKVRLELGDSGEINPLCAEIDRRCTWRRGFAPAAQDQTQALEHWASNQADITLIAARPEIDTVSALNERTSLAFFRRTSYRHELLSWMRLSPSDLGFGVDGLSAPALGFSRFEAIGAGVVLSDLPFTLLDKLGLVAPLISEKSLTSSASAILLFHRSKAENPIETGRVLYRRLLELSRLGFQTWPMSVLADDPQSAEELTKRYGVSDHYRLITALRVGRLPPGALSRRERLPPQALIAV